MIESPFVQVLLLLGTSVAVIVSFQKLHIPSSLGYLLVGLLLGPHTVGPVVEAQQIRVIAEFGIVFLLFTIGLNFSLPQIHALRHQVLGLGTSQVALTTLAVGAGAWALGQPLAAAFVIGAVFAQSSTTIITRQLIEQGEDHSRHGRLATAMSVFQDVTAVPFIVVIPVLGLAVAPLALAGSVGWALSKAVLAFALVFLAGRWLLRPLFHLVAQRRSAELFTLTVLLVSLSAAGVTSLLGLSMAFGAFLAGMMLGETEFRHQVEATVRPFRDVLLGLFFVGIGMLIDPALTLTIWHWGLAGALALLLSKTVLVAKMVQYSGVDRLTSWRTGILLAVGGEFGFALLAIALGTNVLDESTGQIVLTSVLFSMILAPFLIRFNHVLAAQIVRRSPRERAKEVPRPAPEAIGPLRDHVILCGYGRVGRSIASFLEDEGIDYISLDLNADRVSEAHTAGKPVFYGDAANRDVLEAVGLSTARLVVISHNDVADALRILHHIRTVRAGLPVMVRTHDERLSEELREAGATEVVPEALETGLMIASHALLLLDVPPDRVMQRIQAYRSHRYRLLPAAGSRPAGDADADAVDDPPP